MQGTILKYDKDTHKGFISGHDGNRYAFAESDWRGKKPPKETITVDFDFEEDNKKAIDVVPLKGEGSMKAPVLTFILGLIMLISAIVQFDENIPNSGLANSLGVVLILVAITGVNTIRKQKKGRGWAISGLVMAALAFLGTWGNTM